MVSSTAKTKGMKKLLIGFIFIIFITNWLVVNTDTLNAQNSSLNGQIYTMNMINSSSSLYQDSEVGIYIYSKNGENVTLHFYSEQSISWDTTIVALPNSLIPIYHNVWYALNDSVGNALGISSYLKIHSNEPLFVFGSKWLELDEQYYPGLMFESGTQIPDTFLGNKFIVPGVYQSTPSDFFVYPAENNIPITITPTTNANDSLVADSTYQATITYDSYYVANNFNHNFYNFILDTLFPNSLAGSMVAVENCKNIKVESNCNFVFSFPYQFINEPLVNQLYNSQIQVLDTSGNRFKMYNTVREDLFPINTMGQKYICSPPLGGFEIATFTAPYNNTVISFDGVVWGTLNAGECMVKLFKETTFIESSHPVSMVISHSFLRDSLGWFWGGGGMIQVPALEQSSTEGWFFYPSPKFLNDDYLTDWLNLNNWFAQEKSTIVVVTPTIGVNQTLLNNVNIGAIFQPVAGNPQYSYARVEINTGFNEISNPNGLIVWSTSYQTADSSATFGNYICSGAPLVMSFNKPTYDAKIGVVPIDSTLVEAYTICLDAELQFSVTNSNNSDIYINTWEFGDGHTALGDTVFHSFADTGYFHINLFVNNFCDTIKGLVYVVSPPEISLGNDTIICANIPLILDATVPENAVYLWNNGSTNPQITVNAIGEYIVEVHTESACYVTDTINIDMYDPINLFLGNDTILCYLSSLVLDATQPPKAEANYMWQDYSTNSTYTVIYEGQYWVVVENLCTQEHDTINVEELMYPTLNLGGDTTICLGNTLLLDATIPWGVSYVWEDGTIGAVRHIESEGLYWIVASNPCVTVIDSIFVNFDDCGPVLFIPNTFSPNSDGLNDVFEIGAIKNISKLNIMIFNRWGQKLFESNSANFEWNGKYNGKECPEGVYYWVINYEDIFGKSHEANGTVSLLR